MGTQMPLVLKLNTSTPVPANLGVADAILLDASGNILVAVKKQSAQADSTATDVAGLKTDFNALLAKLRAANILT